MKKFLSKSFMSLVFLATSGFASCSKFDSNNLSPLLFDDENVEEDVKTELESSSQGDISINIESNDDEDDVIHIEN